MVPLLILSLLLLPIVILIDSRRRLGRYSWGWALFTFISLFAALSQLGKQVTPPLDRWLVAKTAGTLAGCYAAAFIIYRVMTRAQTENKRNRSHHDGCEPVERGEAPAAHGDLYLEAMREIETQNLREALWVKAYADSGGEEVKAKLLYVKLRANQLSEEKRELEEAADRARDEPAQGLVTVVWRSTRLRATPNATGRVLDRIGEGTTLDLVGRRGRYVRVRLGATGVEGWVLYSSVKVVA